jgi:hypothetical protein
MNIHVWVFEKKSKLKSSWLWVLEKSQNQGAAESGIRKIRIKEHSLVGI